MIKQQNFETLVKTWDRKTIDQEIKELTYFIVDCKRLGGVDYSNLENDLNVLFLELARRQQIRK